MREAARRAAGALPPEEQNRFVERVMKRCSTEKWLTVKDEIAPVAQGSKKAVSANLRSGSDAALKAIAEDSRATRAHLAKTALNGAKEFARKTGNQVIDNAKKLRDLTAAAAQVGGWDQGKSAGVQFKLLQIGGTLTLVSEGQGGGNEE